MAAFQNPEFYRAQAMRLPTYGKPRIISCAEEHPDHLALPRGCPEDLRRRLSDLNVTSTIRDERCPGQPLDVTFQGTLRPEQKNAGDTMLAHDTVVLSATTAFGRTVVAAWLIAQRSVNALVLVHRRRLLDQWIDRRSVFLNLPTTVIGRIGGGRRKPTGLLDVALIQSLVRKGVVDDGVGEYGHLIVDECHHLPAHSFEQVARRAKARFVVGLSATVTRKDGHHPIIFMPCGPVRHRVSAKSQAALRPFEHTVIVRPTAFLPGNEPRSDRRTEFHTLYKQLVDDEARNRCICDDILQVVREGRSPLVLIERHEHLERLANELSARVRTVLVLRGGMGGNQRRAVAEQLAAIPAQEERLLAATGKYIGEGFDDPRLDRFSSRFQCRGAAPSRSTPADYIVFARASGKSACTTTPTSTCQCCRECSTGVVADTKGRFRLNVDLPIPFDGWSRMEVDLLCNDARVVVGLDGAQHLADAVAYRRDRRKDQLLQENGYLVLRFLAEDVAKNLDAVLDAVLRSLTRRREATRLASL